jgi:hypothetical protein
MPMSTARQQLSRLLSQGAPGPFSLADVDALNKSLLKAGFANVRSETMIVTFEFDSAEDYTKFSQDIVVHIRTMIANETEKRKEEIWKAVTDKAKLLYTDHESRRVKLINEAIWIVGLEQ